ncbi:HAD-IIIA family hydrolase [Helicobacter sp. MIT 14-3879]|uniref:D-glycero-alpha-D-manno-heptose-1,7-bisphosphate 7-phosphatase n=1 Tax=Helicobacter sp. MIT 14-3879 TaxID=2040649 RepID=UPI000E1E6A06|nr:HAD-IIIA family hydrolase [Helicobacter sp. MIT 14-3879]RDU60399.1 HAD family hydrolase [Helicobacter sp. MIT 14-3879]
MQSQKAVFFDRDGVINEDLGYVYKIADFRFYEDFFLCAKKFKQYGYKLIVVTNQSGIERGLYNIKDFLTISAYMQECIYKRLKFYLDRIYFCPSLQDSVRRKPACGMLLQAKEAYHLDINHCIMVGDKISDVEAGYNAGLTKLFLLQRGDVSKQVSQTKNDIQETKNKNGSKCCYRIIRTLEHII